MPPYQPQYWPPPYYGGYGGPPIRRPPSRGGIRLLTAALSLGLIWVLLHALPQASGSDSRGKAKAKLPSVSIKGALPCELNKTKRIGLNTAKRVATCVKAKKYAKARLTQKHQAKQFSCLDVLWTGESQWSAWADNPGSSAYGIPQALKRVHGHAYNVGDWKAQVDWGLSYIKGKYRTPCKAWAFWQRQDPNWY